MWQISHLPQPREANTSFWASSPTGSEWAVNWRLIGWRSGTDHSPRMNGTSSIRINGTVWLADDVTSTAVWRRTEPHSSCLMELSSLIGWHFVTDQSNRKKFFHGTSILSECDNWSDHIMEFSLNGAELSLNAVNSGISENMRNHWGMNWAQYEDLLCCLWLSGRVSVSYTGGPGFQPCNPPFWFLNCFVTEFSEFSENI